MKALPLIFASLFLAACLAQPVNDRGVPSSSAHDDTQGAGDPFALFSALESAADPGENIVYSPVSTAQAIGLVQFGARGDTAAQIEAVLGLRAGETGAAELRDKREALSRDTQGATVRIANALFLADDYRFAEAYTDAASRFFAAETATPAPGWK